MEGKKNNDAVSLNAYDRFMGHIRHFFSDTVAEMGRCTWPSRNELMESTVLVVIAIVILGAFVAGVDILAQWFISLITR